LAWNSLLQKKQLYTGSFPQSNWFVLGNGNENIESEECRYELKKILVGTWYERRYTVWFDFFSKNNYNNCGATVEQTEEGLFVSVDVSGLPSKSSHSPRTITMNCFFPIHQNEDDMLSLSATAQDFVDGQQTVTGNDFHIKKWGNMTTPFELYDVRTNMTERYFPFTQTSRMAKIGQPILAGIWPKPIWKNGVNKNPIFNHAARWDYFIRDCVFSGLIGEDQNDIQLIKRNCKTSNYHVQQLSKYGRKNDGHLMMFEAMAFSDGEDHFLTCNVDVCLKNLLGVHEWADCYRPCDEDQYLSQTADEMPFELTTTLDTILETIAPDLEPTELPVTVGPPAHTFFQTQLYTQTLGDPESSDLQDALTECLSYHLGPESGFPEGMDPDLFTLCQYIESIFPDSFA